MHSVKFGCVLSDLELILQLVIGILEYFHSGASLVIMLLHKYVCVCVCVCVCACACVCVCVRACV